MKKLMQVLVFVGMTTAIVHAAVSAGSASKVLLGNYIRYQIAQSVMAQATALAEKRDVDIKDEVRQETAWWLTGCNKTIKVDLESVFGDEASEKFQQFWVEYEKAESAGDMAFLGKLKNEFGFASAKDYAELRKMILEQELADYVSNSGALLGAVERWIKAVDDGDLKKGTLKGWINGDIALKQAPLDPLQAAEAELAPFVANGDEEEINPLDALKATRADKRKKALEDATAGMQQVASERSAVEAEYAAKVQAKATAEAESLMKHADRLSAAEKDAFDQRQKSFGNRLKNVVSATIGAAAGAFTGGIGARAGQVAVDAIWGDTTPAYTPRLPRPPRVDGH